MFLWKKNEVLLKGFLIFIQIPNPTTEFWMIFAKAHPLFKLLSKSYGEQLEKLPLFLSTQFLQFSGDWHSPHCCPSVLQTPPPDLKLDLTTGSLWVGLD